MDFDQLLDAWRSHDTAPPFDMNRDALREALRAEEVKVQQQLRANRRSLWIAWIVGTGMAVFAVFWIAISIGNGWPVIYLFSSALSFALFAFGAGAMWKSRSARIAPRPYFGNSLQEELERGLDLIDRQLSQTRHMLIVLIGGASIFAGSLLFNWTLNSSQGIHNPLPFGWWSIAVVAVLFSGIFRKTREEMRNEKPRLELRQQRLRELLNELKETT